MLVRLLKTNLVMLNPIMRLFYKCKYGAIGIVYMMHRVGTLNSQGITYNENMKVSPKWLEYIILTYRKHGFDFLSLDELSDVLGGKRKQRKPFVVFTLDDGYVDNYTLAYPIFKKYNVPFCVYVATDFPDGKAFLWWYALEEYLWKEQNRETQFVEMRKLMLSAKKEDIVKTFRHITHDEDIDIHKYVCTESMSWNQIEEMAQDSLCTIGGHTISHPAFISLTEDEIEHEIKGGIEILKSHIGKEVIHFAYPFGSLNEVNEREYAIAESYGFRTIVTTLNEVITPKTSRLRIPRYILLNNMN